jgi:Domain of unknown function (DUF1735)
MIKINKLLVPASLAILSLTSCLKDKEYVNQQVGLDVSQSPKVVQILEAPSTDVVVNVSATPLVANLLTITAGADVKQDVTVTLALDNGAIAPADVLPAAEYVLPATLTVTIPKGKNSASLPITLKNTQNLLGTAYELGFRITAVSNSEYSISNGYKSTIAYFIVKNAYAGTYNVVAGGRYNCTGPTVNWIFPQDPTAVSNYASFVSVGSTKEVETIDANKCRIGIVNLGGGTFLYNYEVTIPPGSTGIVDLKPTLVFSANFMAQTSARNLQHFTYNHDTKTFTFGMDYNNNAVPASGNVRIDYEVLTKQ